MAWLARSFLLPANSKRDFSTRMRSTQYYNSSYIAYIALSVSELLMCERWTLTLVELNYMKLTIAVAFIDSLVHV